MTQSNGFNSYVEIFPFSFISSHQQTIVSVVQSHSNPMGKKAITNAYESILPFYKRDYGINVQRHSMDVSTSVVSTASALCCYCILWEWSPVSLQ